ncbi:helix-turn-helix domain-containing protein [Methylococcus geothermalis]|uniref:Helix-turn-helix domain-containing protein n=1 Tax=Methylococcus geothermalis TaxID=2681310 RepID=A0A858Q7P6_9GAMM|nr:helix-turn-helix domain-containing protein [Methylococcus geothermalis]QJD29823.1 helix-turn-helix domain-containing protein [Methylococcus geothermalis]
MYTATLPTPRPMPFAAPIGTVATAALALIGSALAVGGTGSIFEISRAGDWRRMLEARVPFHVDVATADDSQEQHPDLRSASDHLANIRQVLIPAISDMASVLGVSRQAIYKWIRGEVTPEPDKFERILALSHAADAFRDAGIPRASSLLKMKAFEGRSLMDFAAAGQLLRSHIQSLVTEAKAMDEAYDRSGLARSKAKPSEDWRAELSIPGSPER